MVYPGPMGDDEEVVVVLSVMLGGFLLVRWLLGLLGEASRYRPAPWTLCLPVAVLPILSILLVHVGLGWFGDVYVQGDSRYRLQYDAMGLAWVMVCLWALGLLGLPIVREVSVRANRAAAIAGVGAVLGLTAAYLGGNVGDGPGWGVVVFSSGLATAGWLLAWWAVGLHGHAADRITLDFHEPTAWRTAGLLTAVGIVLGRSVAGDWVSVGDTVVGFAQHGWLAGVFVAVEVAWARRSPPPHAPDEPDRVFGGVVPGSLWVALAVLWLFLWPHPNPV